MLVADPAGKQMKGKSMSKKLMLLAAGALTALAFAALPAVASAGSPEVECSGVACGAFTVSGGAAELAKTSGPKVNCTSVTGSGNYTSKTGGSIKLVFHGCTESAFGSSCGSGGTITTNTMTFDNTYLTDNKTTPGVLVTGANVTFTCFGGLVHNQVTGSVMGHLETGCTQHPGNPLLLNFEKVTDGHQKYMQVTGTGTKFDLDSSLNGGAFETASQTGTGKVTLKEAPTVTCV